MEYEHMWYVVIPPLDFHNFLFSHDFVHRSTISVHLRDEPAGTRTARQADSGGIGETSTEGEGACVPPGSTKCSTSYLGFVSAFENRRDGPTCYTYATYASDSDGTGLPDQLRGFGLHSGVRVSLLRYWLLSSNVENFAR